jgi:hypothetical protein
MEEREFKQITVNADTHARLQAKATANRRSMAAQIAWFLDQDDARHFSNPQPVEVEEKPVTA